FGKGPVNRIIGSAIVGGTVSAITGGKFANGAFSAAFATALRADWGRKQKYDSSTSGSQNDGFVKNKKLASKATKYAQEMIMSIDATVSGSPEISQSDLLSYVESIENQWTGTYKNGDGDVLMLEVNLEVVESGGDISVLPCEKCGYRLVDGGLALVRGIALHGGNEMWFSKEYGGQYTAAHEFGHVLGFDHIGNHQLMSEGGGGGNVAKPSFSTIKALFENY
ncbi:hypothetical protein, partial [Pseudoalteromonas rubra]|uniref:hypothetical protein n=1 Tax=Pseudoalteromonas rubra TaxID=43658 RepID=UPI00126EAA7B